MSNVRHCRSAPDCLLCQGLGNRLGFDGNERLDFRVQ
jgi:hypothetical protein